MAGKNRHDDQDRERVRVSAYAGNDESDANERDDREEHGTVSLTRAELSEMEVDLAAENRHVRTFLVRKELYAALCSE